MDDLTTDATDELHIACDILIRMGDSHRVAEGDLRAAMEHHQGALSLALAAFDTQREAEALTLIGLTRLRLGIEGVDDYLLRAYDVAKACKTSRELN